MKREKLLVATLCAAALLSCVPDSASIQIVSAMWGSPNAACEVIRSETQKGSGAVNLGYTSTYWLGLLVASHLDANPISADGQEVNPVSRNDFYISEIAVSYAGKGVPTIAEQVHATAGTVRAGGELYFGTDLLTWEAAEKLRGAAIPDGGLRVDVSVILRGSFASGGNHETAPFVFPLLVTNSDKPKCGEKETLVPVLDGVEPPCGNWGQDGIEMKCQAAAE